MSPRFGIPQQPDFPPLTPCPEPDCPIWHSDRADFYVRCRRELDDASPVLLAFWEERSEFHRNKAHMLLGKAA